MKNKNILIVASAVLLIVLFAVGAYFYKKSVVKRLGFLATENASIFVREHSPQLGDDDAEIYVVEFLDPECESCAAAYPQVKKLLSDHEGQIKLVIRYKPLHKNSKFAIRILEAVRKQGKYWQTLELLFQQQPEWASHHDPKPHLIWGYLQGIGVDVEKVKTDMNDPRIDVMILQDIEDAKELGVRGTPTFFVNGKMPEAFGIESLRKTVEMEL